MISLGVRARGRGQARDGTARPQDGVACRSQAKRSCGCASGTLYTVGGGNTRMLVTIATLVTGSTIGALHLPCWSAQPNIGTVSLINVFGWAPALAISLALFAAIAAFSTWVEKRRHGSLVSGVETPRRGWHRLLHGPWPLLAGALPLL
jgi:hypothetical protein